MLGSLLSHTISIGIVLVEGGVFVIAVASWIDPLGRRRVTIAGNNGDMAQNALERIEATTATVQLGKIYTGTVSSVKDFGAFVENLPGRDGLCHISELSNDYVSSVTDICNVGDEIEVKVIAVDEQDRIKLSRKAAEQELAGAASEGGEE